MSALVAGFLGQLAGFYGPDDAAGLIMSVLAPSCCYSRIAS